MICRCQELQLNPASHLPPVACPLLIEVSEGRLVRAERTGFVERKDRLLDYRLETGEMLTGRFRWTYP